MADGADMRKYGLPTPDLFRWLGSNFELRLFAVLEGYIDESGDETSKLFTLSCITSHGGMWWWFENAWVQWLEKTNLELRRQGRTILSRYHAADCSNCSGEFEGWTREEQIAFAEGLLKVFRHHNVAIISYTVDLRHISEEFPEARGKPKAIAYAWFLQKIMYWIGERLLDDKRYSDQRVSLVHDRTDFGSVLLDAFNAIKNDPAYKHNSRFTTIAPMGWQDCILLQPADLIAYENFKLIERKHAKKTRRKFMERLLELDSIGGRGVEIPREGVRDLNTHLTPESKKSIYKIARIRPLDST
jgi:hypothetical protein